MGIRSWFLANRLQRAERRLKVLHAEQKNLRKKMEELETSHGQGEMAPEAYKATRARLEERRQQLVLEVREVESKEKSLRAELYEAPA